MRVCAKQRLGRAAARLMSQVVYLLGATVTSRLLLPSDFGKAAVIAPITAFAVTFASLGLGSAVIHTRRVTEQLLSTASWLNTVVGVLLTALVAALSSPLEHLFASPYPCATTRPGEPDLHHRPQHRAHRLARAHAAIQGDRLDVACQRDGTTVLPRAWDHLVVSVSMVGLPVGVN